jgi:hypothetical protein
LATSIRGKVGEYENSQRANGGQTLERSMPDKFHAFQAIDAQGLHEAIRTGAAELLRDRVTALEEENRSLRSLADQVQTLQRRLDNARPQRDAEASKQIAELESKNKRLLEDLKSAKKEKEEAEKKSKDK